MKKTVLIVDDNSINLYMLKSVLEGEGLEVIAAENGKDALDKAHPHPPDLIISDILMPVMDGYAFCRQCKSDEQLKNIPFVFYTATYTGSKDEEFASALGVDRFIIKPQEPEVLIGMLQEFLDDKYTLKHLSSKPLGEEMEFFRKHNELLFSKLEKKMSDLERTNQELKTLEEQYRLSFENVSDVVFTVSSDLTCSSMSPSIEKMLGYKPQDFVGRNLYDVAFPMSPESFKKGIENIKSMLNGKIVTGDIAEFTAKDGTIKIGELSGAPIIHDGQVLGMIAILRDVTERMQTEKALKESEKKYRLILESMDDAYFEFDLKGNFTFFNGSLISKIGYAPEELTGMNYRQYVSPETAMHVQRVFSGIYSTKQPVRLFDYEIITKNGQKRWMQSWADLLLGSDSQIIGFRGMSRDITEQKEAEERILRQSKLLEGINSIFYETLTTDNEEEVAQTCLKVAQELTGSKFGFIGEITPDGLFTTTALSDPGWNACTMPETDAARLIENMTIRGMWGQVIFKEQSLVVNNPVSYPDRVGLPEGHPPITSFIGVPLKKQHKVIGMIAMANRESGYTEEIQHDLEGLSVAFVEAIRLKRLEVALRESDTRLRTLSDNLPDGLVYQVIFDESGQQRRFSYISAGIEKLHGITANEVLNDPMALYGQVVEEDRQRLVECESLALANMSSFSTEVRSKMPSGEIKWILLSSAPHRTPDHHVIWDGIEIDITDRKKAEEDLQQSFMKTRQVLGATIHAIAATVETRDPYTAGHQRRVSDLARTIATEMNLPRDQIDGLRLAGTIHDLGKISVPAEILSKPTKLTDIEFSLIKTHSQSGYDILKDIEFPWPIARMVLEHHERMDGSGYPEGLTGEQLLIESRILSVADVVESMASHRPYRPALGLDAALEEINKNKGILYDPEVADACLRLFKAKTYNIPE